MFYKADGPHGLKRNPFKALVAPRPIAWVSSIDNEGAVNLAPFSYFNAVADAPPIVVFAPNGPRPGGGQKDTLSNVESVGEFVINIANWELREAMNQTSAHVPHGVDEMALAGLTAEPSQLVKPPRVKEALVSFECVFLFRVRLPATRPEVENNTVFGRVVGIHIADEIIEDGMVSIEKHRPIARLGYLDYAVIDQVFSMQRPD